MIHAPMGCFMNSTVFHLLVPGRVTRFHCNLFLTPISVVLRPSIYSTYLPQSTFCACLFSNQSIEWLSHVNKLSTMGIETPQCMHTLCWVKFQHNCRYLPDLSTLSRLLFHIIEFVALQDWDAQL